MSIHFVLLMMAVACEVMATTAVKFSDGFTRLVPSAVIVIGYAASFYLFSLTVRTIPLGTAYAVWSGLGMAGAVAAGVLLWQERVSDWSVLAMALIVIGVIVLNLTSEAV